MNETVFLSLAEQKVYERLFLPDFTIGEGLAFYNSVISNGRPFPPIVGNSTSRT
jgi:hypothetical protein